MKKTFQSFSILVVFTLLVACKTQNTNSKVLVANNISKKPNIIILLADDLGFADVGYNGCKDIPTPNIDALAKEGVVFTNGYVTGSVCGPTRAGLLTGRYQQRFGSERNPGPQKLNTTVKVGVPLSETMLSKRLKNRGYKTAAFGKWHLGGESGDKELFPLQRGFDTFFGFLEGAALYIDPNNSERKYMKGNEELVMEQEYYTDAITRESLNFIEENKNESFFMYVAYNAVHAPLQATDKYLSKFKNIKNPKRKLLAAMNLALDTSIGSIVKSLKENGIEEETLIFFLSDNGGKPKNNFSYNLPLKGEKNQFYDGGIHIPFVLKWKGHIQENIKYEYPISSLDIFPTIMGAINEGVKSDWHLDGVNLLPFLNQEKPNIAPHDALYWKEGGHFAMRTNEWKIVKMYKDIELYHLSVDPYEKIDLAKANPGKVSELLLKYKTWDAQNIPAQYGYSAKEFPVKVKRTRRTELKR